ncbi:MAG TPA: hypothetical protein PLQ36_00085 [Candidatus Gracilibacteria bacterium]|nr:hypothetical protein [Candidatus Gracilibacteria bacterium]
MEKNLQNLAKQYDDIQLGMITELSLNSAEKTKLDQSVQTGIMQNQEVYNYLLNQSAGNYEELTRLIVDYWTAKDHQENYFNSCQQIFWARLHAISLLGAKTDLVSQLKDYDEKAEFQAQANIYRAQAKKSVSLDLLSAAEQHNLELTLSRAIQDNPNYARLYQEAKGDRAELAYLILNFWNKKDNQNYFFMDYQILWAQLHAEFLVKINAEKLVPKDVPELAKETSLPLEPVKPVEASPELKSEIVEEKISSTDLVDDLEDKKDETAVALNKGEEKKRGTEKKIETEDNFEGDNVVDYTFSGLEEKPKKPSFWQKFWQKISFKPLSFEFEEEEIVKNLDLLDSLPSMFDDFVDELEISFSKGECLDQKEEKLLFYQQFGLRLEKIISALKVRSVEAQVALEKETNPKNLPYLKMEKKDYQDKLKFINKLNKLNKKELKKLN